MLYDNLARIAAWTPTTLLVMAVLSGSLRLWSRHRLKAESSRRLALTARISRAVFWQSLIWCAACYVLVFPLFRSAEKLSSYEGETFPDFEYRLVSDRSAHRLSELQGKVVVVNFWATWCGPCREDLPTLNRLQEAYADRGVVVLTLADQPVEETAEFIQRVSPRTINGNVGSYDWLDIRTFRPWSVVIDRSGTLREYLFGKQDFEAFERKVRSVL